RADRRVSAGPSDAARESRGATATLSIFDTERTCRGSVRGAARGRKGRPSLSDDAASPYDRQATRCHGLTASTNGHDALQPSTLILFFFSQLLRWEFGRLGFR